MLTFWGFVTAFTMIGGLPTVGGLWMFERWRSRRRNMNGECAACGGSWHIKRSTEPYLIQGRLVCEDCAERARRRMLWHFGLLSIACASATVLAVAGADDVVHAVLLAAALPMGMTVAAIQLMKLANRRAQRRIARGHCPELVMLADVIHTGGLRAPETKTAAGGC